MINDNQLPMVIVGTNYPHVAAYATLIVKATLYNKPFTFNWS